jgi:N-sulfoglucosamine sulfohydrolase
MPEKPNVLVVTCHDLGRHLGCYGNPTVQSPNLDALAADGIRFAHAFTCAPQCSPSRAALYTGRYPHNNGVLGLTHSTFGFDLHPEERHLAQVLHDAGYTTTLIGADHEVRHVDDQSTARRIGMDELIRPRHGDEIADAALARLERFAAGDKPFYLQVGFNEPHRLEHEDPTAEPDYMGFRGSYLEPDGERGVQMPPWLRDTPGGRAEIAELQGAIRYVDGQIGRLLDGLRRLGLEENTLVLFMPDHGLALPRAKCSLYGPGLEVALIVRWTGRGWTGGRVQDELISNVDVFPTILDALGLTPAANVHGRSFLGLLDGSVYQPRDELFGEMTFHDYYDPRRTVRTATHSLIVNFTAAPSFMNPSQSWRPRTDPVVPVKPLLAYHPIVELFDLQNDPDERENVVEEQVETAKELLGRLQRWMEETDDPLLQGAVTPPMHRWALQALATGSVPDTSTPPVA